MHALVLGLVVAAAGDPVEVSAAFTAGAEVVARDARLSDGAQGWGHLGLTVRRDFDAAFVELSGSVLATGNLLTFSLRDLGSRVTLGTRLDGFVREFRLELLPFNPVLRLPYFDWANAVGKPTAVDAAFTPALAVEARTTLGTAWLATRFRSILNHLQATNELRPDLMFGVDLALPAGLAFGVRGAWLQYGLHPALAQQGITRESRALLASGRLEWTWKEPVGAAVDLATYASDPLRFTRFFTLEPRTTDRAATLALEGGAATQLLVSQSEFARQREQLAGWVDLQARVRLHELRLFATARYQSLTLLTFDAQGLPPTYALSDGATVLPRLTGFLGFDWRWRRAGLTPGVLLSVWRPAAITQQRFDFGGANPPPGLEGVRTVIVEPDLLLRVLPADAPVRPAGSLRFSLRWDPVAALTVLAYVDAEKSWNEWYVVGGEPTALDLVVVRTQLQLQARF